MKRFLTFAEYMKQGFIKKIMPDTSKMKQMRNMAHVREEFIEQHIDDKFIALHLEAYHDIITELLYSHLYKHGLQCTTADSLLAFAVQSYPICAENENVLLELFTLRHTIHSIKQQKIKKFLQDNHEILQEIIAELKK